MKAILLEGFGGIEKLKLTNIPTPIPADDEILIKIKCAGVNPVDWKIRAGYLKERIPHELPIIPGWDATGVVSAVGKKVSKFKVGDEVFAYCRKPIVKWGTYAEYVCVQADNAAFKPKNISFAQAASIPLAGLTAWQSLIDVGKLEAGQTVLIHAGAGGVGSLAIQIAKNAGATVYTTASQKNQDYVKSLGADGIIDYQKDNFVEKISEWNPDGIDIVFDTLGGGTYTTSFEVLKPKGCIVSILEQPNEILSSQYKVNAYYVFVSPNGKELQQIADAISKGKIKPPEILQMPLNQAGEAQEQVRTGHIRGKIVLAIAD